MRATHERGPEKPSITELPSPQLPVDCPPPSGEAETDPAGLMNSTFSPLWRDELSVQRGELLIPAPAQRGEKSESLVPEAQRQEIRPALPKP